ncbi:MAG: type II secretion system F family protein [Rhizobiaceae bacterium]
MILLAMIGLAVLTVGTLAYALMYNSISNNKKSSSRIKSLQADKQTNVKNQVKKVDDKQRRKARENALKNVEEQRSSGRKANAPSLSMKISQAGMTLSMRNFYIVSAVLAIFGFLGATAGGAPLHIAGGISFVCGLGLPRFFISFKRARRFRAFTLIFPNAIDVIVRGIRSGLPLNDCLRIIANDADEPVRGEFRKMIEATQMGITVPEACERLYESVPTPETNFFSIVIAIQSSAGGNLSEALSGLSKVLRERRKMADKIQAFSTEAKTSAIIIGALPFVVAIAVYFTTPDYLNPLWETQSGKNVLMFIAVSMTLGVGIMKKMINFKF